MSVCSESAVYTLLAVKKAKQNFTIPYTQLPIRKCFFNCLFGYCRYVAVMHWHWTTNLFSQNHLENSITSKICRIP